MLVGKYTRGAKLIFLKKVTWNREKFAGGHSRYLFLRSAAADQKEILHLISFLEYFVAESMATTQIQSEMTCDLPLDLIKKSPGFSFDIG